MEKEYFIIRRMPWDYDGLPEYYTDNGYSRDIRKVKIFDTLIEASDVKRNLNDPEHDHIILRM